MTSNVDFEDCKCKISPDFIIYMLARPTLGGGGCGHKIVLRMNMSYWEYMSFRMTCLMTAYILVECLSLGWHICYMFCFTGRHFLLDDMFYLRVCIIGGHVLQFKLFHWNTCLAGGHILLHDSSYRRTLPV